MGFILFLALAAQGGAMWLLGAVLLVALFTIMNGGIPHSWKGVRIAVVPGQLAAAAARSPFAAQRGNQVFRNHRLNIPDDGQRERFVAAVTNQTEAVRAVWAQSGRE